MADTAATTSTRSTAIALNRALLGFARHWLLTFNLFWGVFVIAPWFAPVLMASGQERAANAIYLAYVTQCHQLPQRSFFLFGLKPMYSLSEIQATWQNTNNPFLLRQFNGNPQMGWKVAWSDRMVAMWTSIFVGGIVYWPLRKRLRPLSLWAFVLLILPMALDGGTHLLSDFAGLGDGFRDSNAWLAALTGNVFPANFYASDSLGSFNSWMRLLSGVLFGIAAVWLAYPHLQGAFTNVAREIENKFRRAGLPV
jgi:uncharacterized membrane protein